MFVMQGTVRVDSCDKLLGAYRLDNETMIVQLV